MIAYVPVDVIIPLGALAYQLCDLRVAPAQNNTFFLAKPSEKLSELERHPEEVDAPAECVVCNVDNGDDADVLQCDKVCKCRVPAFKMSHAPLSATIRIT